jgi:hypothetical protein
MSLNNKQTTGLFWAITLFITVFLSMPESKLLAQPLSDPTRPPSQELIMSIDQAVYPNLILSYTSTGDRRALAIINGVKAKVGDSVYDGVEIKEIHMGRVILIQGEELIELLLTPSDLKSYP